MIDYANDQLKRTDEFATKEFKEGVCVMIQQMMFRTDTYSGFMFINNDDTEAGSFGYYSRRYFKSSNL